VSHCQLTPQFHAYGGPFFAHAVKTGYAVVEAGDRVVDLLRMPVGKIV
jgi:hypothetical protein